MKRKKKKKKTNTFLYQEIFEKTCTNAMKLHL